MSLSEPYSEQRSSFVRRTCAGLAGGKYHLQVLLSAGKSETELAKGTEVM